MLRIDTLEELIALTDLQTAVDVVAIGAICSTVESTEDDWCGVTSFSEKVEKKFSSITDGDPARAKKTMAIHLACHDYENAKALNGFGKYRAKPLSEWIAPIGGKRLITDAPYTSTFCG